MTFYSGQGRLKEAIANSEITHKLNSKVLPPIAADMRQMMYPNLSMYCKSGDTDGARAIISSIKEKYDDNMLNISCIVDVNLALAEEDYKKLENLFNDCKEDLIASDGQRIVFLVEAFVLAGEKKYNEGADKIEEFADFAGQPEYIRDFMKMSFYIDGELYDKALKMDSELMRTKLYDNGEYRRFVTLAHNGAGNREKAKEEMDILMKIWKNSDPEIEDFQEMLALKEKLEG